MRIVKAAHWADLPAVKTIFGSADVLRDGRVLFNIGGNKYRLVVWVNCHYEVVTADLLIQPYDLSSSLRGRTLSAHGA